MRDAGDVGATETSKGAAYLRRPVSPVLHLRTRSFFLTLACRECQLQKTGRGCLPGNRGAGFPAPGGPSRSLLEDVAVLKDLTVRGLPSGTRARRFVFPVRTSGSATPPPLHTSGSSWDALFALPRPPARTTLLRHARRRSDRASWISSVPFALLPGADHLPREGRIDPRPVAGRRRRIIGTGQSRGDKWCFPPPVPKHALRHVRGGRKTRHELAPLLAPPDQLTRREALTRSARQVGVSRRRERKSYTDSG